MNTVIVHILCEGQTEELFVKRVLKPYFSEFNIVLKSLLVFTSKKKNIRGGLVSYAKAKEDLWHCMAENSRRSSETHFYTTMFDFYALPTDFPGYAEAISQHDAYDKVDKLEKALGKDINSDKFVPYIQLHEFEALLFCDPTRLESLFPESKKEIQELSKALYQCNDNPELINQGEQTAPSKRILKAIEGSGQYRYNKPQDGVEVTRQIGIDTLMKKCKHFGQWINRLTALSTQY